jgi:hypothetical protein
LAGTATSPLNSLKERRKGSQVCGAKSFVFIEHSCAAVIRLGSGRHKKVLGCSGAFQHKHAIDIRLQSPASAAEWWSPTRRTRAAGCSNVEEDILCSGAHHVVAVFSASRGSVPRIQDSSVLGKKWLKVCLTGRI